MGERYRKSEGNHQMEAATRRSYLKVHTAVDDNKKLGMLLCYYLPLGKIVA